MGTWEARSSATLKRPELPRAPDPNAGRLPVLSVRGILTASGCTWGVKNSAFYLRYRVVGKNSKSESKLNHSATQIISE